MSFNRSSKEEHQQITNLFIVGDIDLSNEESPGPKFRNFVGK